MKRLRSTMNFIILALLLSVSLSGCSGDLQSGKSTAQTVGTYTLGSIPEYKGESYVSINGNEPEFKEDEITEESFESYSSLDSLGRCGVAQACIGRDIMPTKKRGAIGQVKPTGWHLVKYDFVDGKYLYNRCHLIGYQLTGENANEKNLITGTRSFNLEGMLPFEEEVADYVKDTGNHVMYRVTPIFEGDQLIAKGVQMEAKSVEDDGKGVSYNVFVYNVEDGVDIDYASGDSHLSGEKVTTTEKINQSEQVIRGNKRSKVYHSPGQRDYAKMSTSKQLVTFTSEEEAKKAGYRKAKH